jgi:hypothetical protein
MSETLLRNRVVKRFRMLGSELAPHPGNFRTHPESQTEALRGVLEEVGQVGELLAYHSERNGGKLTLCDGHLRAEVWADQMWDIAVTDLTDAEADKILLTHDPLAALAGADASKLDALLSEVQTESGPLADMLAELGEANGIGEDRKLKPLDVKPPPKMSWVLIAIPTVRFGEIAADIERLGAICTVCETTVNDVEENGQSRFGRQADAPSPLSPKIPQ